MDLAHLRSRYPTFDAMRRDAACELMHRAEISPVDRSKESEGYSYYCHDGRSCVFKEIKDRRYCTFDEVQKMLNLREPKPFL